MEQTLGHIENRIMSISHLYSLLYTKHNLSYINAYEYFSLLVDNIQNTLQNKEIDIQVKTDIELYSEVAVYCGFIINEAVSNALQHAFKVAEKGTIIIGLDKKDTTYHLTIHDDGKGFDSTKNHESLGLIIIESLATYQLHGVLEIEGIHGIHINIRWEERHV